MRMANVVARRETWSEVREGDSDRVPRTPARVTREMREPGRVPTAQDSADSRKADSALAPGWLPCGFWSRSGVLNLNRVCGFASFITRNRDER